MLRRFIAKEIPSWSGAYTCVSILFTQLWGKHLTLAEIDIRMCSDYLVRSACAPRKLWRVTL